MYEWFGEKFVPWHKRNLDVGNTRLPAVTKWLWKLYFDVQYSKYSTCIV